MSKGQEGVILWTPAVLLYNGFPVKGKNGDYVSKVTMPRRLKDIELKRPTLES